DEKRKSKTTPAVLLEIIKEEGLLAPYRGWFPVISSLCCSNFVYFYTFNSLKALWVKGQHSTTGKDLVLGVVAGVVNVLLTTPLWVVNTRLKLQGAKFRNEDIVPTNYRGIIDAFHQIVRDEGVLALWNGTFPSLLLVFNPAIQFMFYEGFKRKLLKKQLQLTSLDAFVIGAIAKAVATTLTYPLQTVQSILRFGRHRLNPENRTLGSLRNVLYLLQQRVRRFGLVGLYKGLEAKLLQTVLTAALMFLVYEKLTAATFTQCSEFVSAAWSTTEPLQVGEILLQLLQLEEREEQEFGGGPDQKAQANHVGGFGVLVSRNIQPTSNSGH
ncbi:Peroxisomal membrane protein PMP34, partial [Lamprotornis superbus]